jgi:hypothetical protein
MWRRIFFYVVHFSMDLNTARINGIPASRLGNRAGGLPRPRAGAGCSCRQHDRPPSPWAGLGLRLVDLLPQARSSICWPSPSSSSASSSWTPRWHRNFRVDLSVLLVNEARAHIAQTLAWLVNYCRQRRLGRACMRSGEMGRAREAGLRVQMIRNAYAMLCPATVLYYH